MDDRSKPAGPAAGSTALPIRLENDGTRDLALAARLTDLYPVMRRLAAVAADSDIEPDDLVQEAFTRVFAAARDGHLPDDLAAYVRRAIFNLRANERRSKARSTRAHTRLTASVDAGQRSSYPSDAGAVLDAVSAVDRTLIFLVDIERLATAEAAAAVGISATAARARLSRARRQIRSVLADAAHDEDGPDEGHMT